MTIIMNLRTDGWPVTFSDLLISAEGPTGHDVSIPTVGQVGGYPRSDGNIILGLRQKVVVINDVCVVAWAGLYRPVPNALADLKKFAERHPLTAQGVRKLLLEHTKASGNETAFLGWVCDREKKTQTQFGANVSRTDTSLGPSSTMKCKLARSLERQTC